MKEFVKKYRWWLILIAGFIAVRVVVFMTFWQASLNKGGWMNFYSQTDLYFNVLNLKYLFRGVCGGNPLYITFTSFTQLIYNNQWAVFIAQSLMALIVIYYSYKIFTLFFGKNISYIAALVLAIEPFYAWNNFLFASENLFALFIISGFYYFFLYIKSFRKRDLILSSVILSSSLLVRPNGLFVAQVACVILIFLYFFRNRIGIKSRFLLKDLIAGIILFNFAYSIFAFGWMLSNKIEFDDFRMSNGYATNIYYFNVPALLSYKNNISEPEAKQYVNKMAEDYMGMKITNIGDCNYFGNEKYKKFLAYTSQKGKEYIMNNLFIYGKLHLIKMSPFYIQPAYFHMYEAYTGYHGKPDMTSALLSGNTHTISQFFKNPDFKIILYLSEILIWAMISISLLFGFFYSIYKDKGKITFFIVANILILYNAFAVSPFITPKYRFPFYALFIMSFIYMLNIIYVFIIGRRIKNI